VGVCFCWLRTVGADEIGFVVTSAPSWPGLFVQSRHARMGLLPTARVAYVPSSGACGVPLLLVSSTPIEAHVSSSFR